MSIGLKIKDASGKIFKIVAEPDVRVNIENPVDLTTIPFTSAEEAFGFQIEGQKITGTIMFNCYDSIEDLSEGTNSTPVMTAEEQVQYLYQVFADYQSKQYYLYYERLFGTDWKPIIIDKVTIADKGIYPTVTISFSVGQVL